MSNTHDIRVWAREHGFPDLGDNGPLPLAVREAYRARETDPDEDPVEAALASVPEADREVAPVVKEKMSDRFRRRNEAPRSSPRRAKSSSARVPRSRVSIENILTVVWGGLSAAVGKASIPVGFIMSQEAPVAGAILEDVLKDTFVDTVLQPFARTGEQSKAVGALLGPPILVAAMQAAPHLREIIRPILRQNIGMWIEVAGPKFDEMAKRAEKFEKQYGEDVDRIMEGLDLLLVMTDQAESEGQPA